MRSASRDPIEGEAALELLDGVNDLYVAKGRKVVHIALPASRPSDEELLGMMLGRSGKLRAPTMRVGSKLIVGYNADLLGDALK